MRRSSGVTYIHLWELRKGKDGHFVFGDLQVVMDSCCQLIWGHVDRHSIIRSRPKVCFDSMMDVHASLWGRIGVFGKKLITRFNGRGEHL